MNVKIYADELAAAANFSTFSTLENDGLEAGSMYNAITDFVANSAGKLSGDQWDAAYNKLNEYSALLTERVSLAASLSNAISSALKLLIDYMEDYPMLDYSKLEEIKQTRRQCSNTIDNIKRIMYATTTVEVFNEETQENELQTVNLYNSNEIAQFNARISELEEDIIELDKLIGKLEGLEAVYNQAQQILDDAFGEISEFNNKVGSIVPTAKVVYVPAG